MIKIGFAGFGEVNTPIEVIERKCKAAYESLKTPKRKCFRFIRFATITKKRI